jgi:hypothetical protein
MYFELTLLYKENRLFLLVHYVCIFLVLRFLCGTGLPDFSWSKHTYHNGKNIPNNYELYQTVINCTTWQ